MNQMELKNDLLAAGGSAGSWLNRIKEEELWKSRMKNSEKK